LTPSAQPVLDPAALVALAAAAAIAAIGCALLLRSGGLERRGLVAGSRALARRAGLWMGAGTLLEVPAAALLLLGMAPAARRALLGGDPVAAALGAVAVTASLGSGFAGLLAGLSGKPRPAGGFAAGLLVAAVAASVLLRLRL
jgi:hypothetical protein